MPLKRKQESSEPSRKKTKLKSSSTVDDLPWKSVSHLPTAGSFEDDDGILELEEVENVEVVYEDTEAGRVIKFNVLENPSAQNPNETEESEKRQDRQEAIEDDNDDDDFDAENLLPDWCQYNLHPQLLRALYDQKFTTPTPIQSSSIPKALSNRDVIGIAETGSGKTLAYGLPILHELLTKSRTARHGAKGRRRLQALILTPTRELALQVSSHLNACLNSVYMRTKQMDPLHVPPEMIETGDQGHHDMTPGSTRLPPPVSVAAVVGGLSTQKQKRIISRGVDVLVATPGRLWDILQGDDLLAGDIKSLKFLVLDEADRMIEIGHFVELDNILRLTLREHQDQDGTNPDIEEIDKTDVSGSDLQTFVFSATLSKDLQRNLKRQHKAKRSRKKEQSSSTLDDLVMRIDFRDPEPEIIDLSPEGGVVSSLQESQVECLSADKDSYLYYFLLRYSGRSLVFLSSIDGIRRIAPFLDLLNIKNFPLHSQLEQKQRLKNLDRFKSSASSVLLATDIAARGLDIPSVDHVIHYQIPRSADAYVHRNGRTARATRSGFSLIMCAPDERKVVRALLNSLGRKESDIPYMEIDLHMLDKLKMRVQVAKKIDSMRHRVSKANHEKKWLHEAAEAMEIQLDSSEEDSKSGPTKRERKSENAKTAALKLELRQLLSQPLISPGVSTRYITSGHRPIADELLAGDHHETMLGLKKTPAGSDTVFRKTKKQADQDYEIWDGFQSTT